ncbi:hypothetical protein X948_2895 [Burkholderia pseudomallei MSHR5608]|nr:hypothetical protein X948_2895 [Burkholderia pseudomallei MSHR5608]
MKVQAFAERLRLQHAAREHPCNLADEIDVIGFEPGHFIHEVALVDQRPVEYDGPQQRRRQRQALKAESRIEPDSRIEQATRQRRLKSVKFLNDLGFRSNTPADSNNLLAHLQAGGKYPQILDAGPAQSVEAGNQFVIRHADIADFHCDRATIFARQFAGFSGQWKRQHIYARQTGGEFALCSDVVHEYPLTAERSNVHRAGKKMLESNKDARYVLYRPRARFGQPVDNLLRSRRSVMRRQGNDRLVRRNRSFGGMRMSRLAKRENSHPAPAGVDAAGQIRSHRSGAVNILVYHNFYHFFYLNAVRLQAQ